MGCRPWSLGAVRLLVVGWFAWSGFFVSTSVVAQAVAEPGSRSSDQTVAIRRFDEADLNVSIDGRLDEAVWQSVPYIDDFLVIEPDTMAPVPYATRLRMFASERGLYVGFELDQPAETLVSRLSARDQRQINRDAVFITLDSSGEGRYGYWFGVALGDSLLDGTVLPERRYGADWDGPWYGASAQTDTGWSAEMFLPWSMMSMPADTDLRRMGVFVSRRVAHLNQRWAWPPIPDTQQVFLSALPLLEMEGVGPRQQYSLYPYVSSTLDEVQGRTEYRAGMDLFWRPSTNFQLSATLNPDFGNVEADDVIVNLTAFETFFPEKRLFFLEGQEIFVATPRAAGGGRDGPTTLLNTRRIGGAVQRPATPDGFSVAPDQLNQQAELLGAGKVTGQQGAWRYGVLFAGERDSRFRAVGEDDAMRLNQDGSNYGIARVLYEDSPGGAYRGLGWMGTLTTHDARQVGTQGVDAHYLTASGRLNIDAQVLWSNPDDGPHGRGAFVDLRYSPQRGRNHIVALDYFDRQIDINDLGFQRRNDLLGTRYVYVRRSSDFRLARDQETQLILSQEWNHDHQSVRSGVFLSTWIERDDLSRWRGELNYFPARYEDRNSFGNGVYRIDARTQVGLGYSTDSARPLAAQFDGRYQGEDLGGSLYSLQGRLIWHPQSRLTTDLTMLYRDRDGWLLHQGGRQFATFAAEEWQTRLSFNFFLTARQQLRAALQWVGIDASAQDYYLVPERPGALLPDSLPDGAAPADFSISTLNLQLRYRWEIAPLSDIFVVYTRNSRLRGDAGQRFTQLFRDAYDEPLAEQLVVKFRYRLGN